MSYTIGARSGGTASPTGITTQASSSSTASTHRAAGPNQSLIGGNEVGDLGLFGALLGTQSGVNHQRGVVGIVDSSADAEAAEPAIATFTANSIATFAVIGGTKPAKCGPAVTAGTAIAT